jgi:hypothetical protein
MAKINENIVKENESNGVAKRESNIMAKYQWRETRKWHGEMKMSMKSAANGENRVAASQ